jgi:hypothetical protein
VTWRRSVHLSGAHRKALLALSIRTRQSLETLTREALQRYLAATGADSLESLASQTGLTPAVLWDQALQQYLRTRSTPSPSNNPSGEGDI